MNEKDKEIEDFNTGDETNIPEDYDIDSFYPKDDDAKKADTDEIDDEYEDDVDRSTAETGDGDDTAVFTPIKPKKEKSGKLSTKQILIIAAVFLIYTVVLLTASWLIFYRPTASTGKLPFDITPSEQKQRTEFPEKSGGDQEEKPQTTDDGYVENGYQYNILFVGHDKLAYLADVTMIISCDTKNNTVSVMQIPRDTYVSEEKLTGKINAMFSTYYNDARIAGSDDAYMQALDDYATLLEKNLCINIHHVAIINLNGFKNIVNALGGVDVYVPNAMYYSDPAQGLYIDIPAGMQHLDGETAEGFVRFRSGYVQADLGRANAQKIFMTAFFNKLKTTIKSVDVGTLNSLITEVQSNVHTDMTFSDMMYFAKLALKIDLDSITMMTAPGSVSGMYYVINRTATLDAINKYFNVYNKEISDSIFDRNRVFCDTESEYVSAVYYDLPDNVLDKEYTADTIDESSIYIARLQSWVPTNETYDPEPEQDGGEDVSEEDGDNGYIPAEEMPFDISENEENGEDSADGQGGDEEYGEYYDNFTPDTNEETEESYGEEYTEEYNG